MRGAARPPGRRSKCQWQPRCAAQPPPGKASANAPCSKPPGRPQGEACANAECAAPPGRPPDEASANAPCTEGANGIGRSTERAGGQELGHSTECAGAEAECAAPPGRPPDEASANVPCTEALRTAVRGGLLTPRNPRHQQAQPSLRQPCRKGRCLFSRPQGGPSTARPPSKATTAANEKKSTGTSTEVATPESAEDTR